MKLPCKSVGITWYFFVATATISAAAEKGKPKQYTVFQKVYHPNSNDFNSSCPILVIFGTDTIEYANKR